MNVTCGGGDCRLRHRGPDWSGLHQHGDCYLAHQRLAIVDPASGDQPLFNEDKSIVVTVCYLYLLLLSIYPHAHKYIYGIINYYVVIINKHR